MCVGFVFERCKSKNKRYMEPGPSIVKNDKAKISNNVPDDGNVLQPVWFRRDTNHANQINRLLLWCQFGFVLPCGILLWILLLIFG